MGFNPFKKKSWERVIDDIDDALDHYDHVLRSNVAGDVYVGGTTQTDMGYDLEGKNTALTMGEMAPGEYTEMFGNNTAYNENKEKEKGTLDYVAEYGIPVATALAQTYLTSQYNKKLQNQQNAWNAEQAELNRQFNANEAEKARQYETNMANTAHQREMADLLATGLNPVNTATGGGGAATPGGSAASGTPAAGTNPAYMDHTALSNSALSLAETAKALKEMPYISKQKKSEIANTEADTILKTAQTGTEHATTEKAEVEMENLDAQTKKALKEAGYTEQMTKNAIKEHDLIIAQIENAESDTEVKKAEAEIKAWEARHPILARTFAAIGGVAGGVIGGSATGAAKAAFTKRPAKIGF